MVLRDWLEERRSEAELRFHETFDRPPIGTGLPTEAQVAASEVTLARIAALTAGATVDPAARSTDEAGRWLLAALLDWHRRDSRQAWWDYFRLRELPLDDLVGESEPLGGLAFDRIVGQEKQSDILRLTFPPQDHKVGRGANGWEDETGRGVTIHAVDDEHGELLIRRGKTVDAPPPRALLKGGPLDGRAMREALGRLADSVIAGGIDGDGPYRAVRDLLLGRSPRIAGRADGGALVEPGETVLQAARRIAVGLPEAETVLAIQGPPGTGKTYTGGRMIVELVRAGRRVGISAQSHKAITNLLRETVEAAREAGVPLRALQRIDGRRGGRRAGRGGRGDEHRDRPGPCRRDGRRSSPGPAGCSPARSSSGASTSCSSTKPGSSRSPTRWRSARRPESIVLLGDPNQLPQVSQGVHPDGAGASALEHVLGADANVWRRIAACSCRSTYRMHPRRERLRVGAVLRRPARDRPAAYATQSLAGGRHRDPLADRSSTPGDASRRAAEAAEVAELVEPAASGRPGPTATGGRGRSTVADIVVVAPYNAHVAAIQARVERRIGGRVRVGTVDKFQGQEAPVVDLLDGHARARRRAARHGVPLLAATGSTSPSRGHAAWRSWSSSPDLLTVALPDRRADAAGERPLPAGRGRGRAGRRSGTAGRHGRRLAADARPLRCSVGTELGREERPSAARRCQAAVGDALVAGAGHRPRRKPTFS